MIYPQTTGTNMYRNILSHLWSYKLTLTMGLTVLLLCLAPSVHHPLDSVNGGDKIIHALVFAALAIGVYSEYLYKHRIHWHNGRIWKPLALLLLFGIGLEVMQGSLTPYRNGDLYDLSANTLGVCLSTICIYLFLLIRRKAKQ